MLWVRELKASKVIKSKLRVQDLFTKIKTICLKVKNNLACSDQILTVEVQLKYKFRDLFKVF